MKTIKRPYTPVCDLELVPVECISDFAVILPRAFIAVSYTHLILTKEEALSSISITVFQNACLNKFTINWMN